MPSLQENPYVEEHPKYWVIYISTSKGPLEEINPNIEEPIHQ